LKGLHLRGPHLRVPLMPDDAPWRGAQVERVTASRAKSDFGLSKGQYQDLPSVKEDAGSRRSFGGFAMGEITTYSLR
jgi:hypothetical protein